MDAVTYLRTKGRICKAYPNCMGCPMAYESKHSVTCSQSQIEYERPEEAVEIVEKWSEEHPKKTLLTNFLEKYPNAILNDNGVPLMCPNHLDSTRNITCSLQKTCVECWNEPLED